LFREAAKLREAVNQLVASLEEEKQPQLTEISSQRWGCSAANYKQRPTQQTQIQEKIMIWTTLVFERVSY